MNEAAVLSVVDKIAEKLAVPATEVIGAFAIGGIREILFSVMCLLLSVFIWIFFGWLVAKTVKSESSMYYDKFVYVLALVLVGAVGVVAGAVLVEHLSAALLWWYSPKSYAIVTIMELLAQ